MYVVIGDNYMYLTYYVCLVAIKELIDDTGKSLFLAGNRNPFYWPSATLPTVPFYWPSALLATVPF